MADDASKLALIKEHQPPPSRQRVPMDVEAQRRLLAKAGLLDERTRADFEAEIAGLWGSVHNLEAAIGRWRLAYKKLEERLAWTEQALHVASLGEYPRRRRR